MMSPEKIQQKMNAPHECEVRIVNTEMGIMMKCEMQKAVITGSLWYGENKAYFNVGDRRVCSLDFSDFPKSWCYTIMRRTLNGIISKVGERDRKRLNRRRRAELAANVKESEVE